MPFISGKYPDFRQLLLLNRILTNQAEVYLNTSRESDSCLPTCANDFSNGEGCLYMRGMGYAVLVQCRSGEVGTKL